jgi:metallo-beta-lactamase family protein
VHASFLGAAGEVTGSCYLVETGEVRFLVDCGMFQSGATAVRKNLDALDFELDTLDFVLLTHAHIDHSGLLPRLAALGFRGSIHTTSATADLLEVMLADSAHIQEKEAEWVNRHRHRSRRFSRRSLAPLYTVNQARECQKQVNKVAFDAEFSPHPLVRARFRDAGHILGSASIEVWVTEGRRTRKLVFSGDLGQPGRPLMNDPTPIEEADILFVESTYGNRLHKGLQETIDELVHVVTDTLARKRGNVLIPAFAVGRTQEILFMLFDLVRQGRLRDLDVFLDSPLAIRATEITLKHTASLDAETRDLVALFRKHELPFRLKFTEEVEQSIALNAIRSGAIIVSASGMCDAGRIKHHLVNNLPRPECSVLITGFQAMGTLGRRLVDGARSVTIFGEEVPVRANLHTLGGLSAHADQQALLGWLGGFLKPPEKCFVVHGEAETARIFRDRVESDLGWNATVPGYRERVEI